MHGKKLKLSILRNHYLTNLCNENKFISILSNSCDVNSAICMNPEFVGFSKKVISLKTNIDAFILRRDKRQGIKGEIVIRENESLFEYDFEIKNEVIDEITATQKVNFMPRLFWKHQTIKPNLCFTSFETEQVLGKNVLVEKFFEQNCRTIDYYTHYRAWILRDFVDKTENNQFSHLFFSNCFNRVTNYYICKAKTFNGYFKPAFPFRLMRIKAKFFREFLTNNSIILKKTKLSKPVDKIERSDIYEILQTNQFMVNDNKGLNK